VVGHVYVVAELSIPGGDPVVGICTGGYFIGGHCGADGELAGDQGGHGESVEELKITVDVEELGSEQMKNPGKIRCEKAVKRYRACCGVIERDISSFY